MLMSEAEELYGLCLSCARSVYSKRRPTPDYAMDAAHQMLMIWAHESAGGKYRRQLKFSHESEKGAWGVFQMESIAVEAIQNRLKRDKALAERANHWFAQQHMGILSGVDNIEDIPVAVLLRLMCVCDSLAVVMARLYLYLDPQAIGDTPQEWAVTAKRWWNTSAGKATTEDYEFAYMSLVSEQIREKVG